MLSEGEKAPSFELDSDSGKRVSLGDFRGQHLVFYFYPKDNTPGCTREAQSFSEARRKLAAAGAAVVGVSKDSIKSHCGFRDKYTLSFPLLSDPDLAVHRAYGTYGEKTMYGKKVLGTIRSTFLIGPEGNIAKAWRNVRVDGHVDEVLAALKGGSAAPGKVAAGKPSKAKAAAETASLAKSAGAKKKAAAKTGGKKA